MADNNKWFVIHTYSGYENKVAQNILTAAKNKKMDDQILNVLIPVEIVNETKDDSKTENDDLMERDFDGENEAEDISEDTGREQTRKAKKKSKKPVERKLFPGYVMVELKCIYKKRNDCDEEELSMTDEAWYLIRNTRGVTGFVGPGSKPVPLSDKEVESLGIARKVTEVDYKVGDLVTILSGPFSGFSGVVGSIDLAKEMVTVMISMLGRETPTELGLDQVEIAHF